MRQLVPFLVAVVLLIGGQRAAQAQLENIPGLPGKIEMQNHLRQLGLFYSAYVAERGRPPRKLEDFTDYIKRDGRQIVELIEKKHIVVVLGGRPNAQRVLAYQRLPRNGSHVAVMGDRSVRDVSSAELKKLLAEE